MLLIFVQSTFRKMWNKDKPFVYQMKCTNKEIKYSRYI